MGLIKRRGKGDGDDDISVEDAAAGKDEADVSDADIRGDIRALADEKLFTKMGVRRELKHLPEVLHDGEQLLNLASGEYDDNFGLLVVTDQRLVFYERGVMRAKQEDFPYSRISSVQTGRGMVRGGSLTVHVSGTEGKIEHIRPKGRADEIGDYIRQRIKDAVPVQDASGKPDAAERLQKLQAMLDAGIISQAEFDTQRAKIIADI